MEETVDLRLLGSLLRQRRKALDLTREDVAVRAGVTPAYLYLIESARPRSGGTPSRPKREFLRRWAEALGMDEQATDEVLRLAGYAPVDDAEAPAAARSAAAIDAPARRSAQAHDAFLAAPMEVRAAVQSAPVAGMMREESAGGRPPLDLSSEFSHQTGGDRELLMARLDAVLDRADRSQTVWRETVRALDTLLDYLAKRLDEGDDGI